MYPLDFDRLRSSAQDRWTRSLLDIWFAFHPDVSGCDVSLKETNAFGLLIVPNQLHPLVPHTAMASPISPLVVFIARESAATGCSRSEFKEWLLDSLQYVADQHTKSYNTVGWQLPKFFPFIHGGNEPWCPRATHTAYMLSVVAEAKTLGCPLILVLSGWSGLATCPLMHDKIFNWFEDAGMPVKVRVFADMPR
ncbi:hypothetical protein N7463_003878 [Penicillium fimorum]|uniref:Uncharacterized protein n=1 Tax=Penicillium fimorum TaxID=1882269 RepID=A0A9X0C9V3_9EURO|nr:hypothetical protein N7463_003878 [Penicillium fimorum]